MPSLQQRPFGYGTCDGNPDTDPLCNYTPQNATWFKEYDQCGLTFWYPGQVWTTVIILKEISPEKTGYVSSNGLITSTVKPVVARTS